VLESSHTIELSISPLICAICSLFERNAIIGSFIVPSLFFDLALGKGRAMLLWSAEMEGS
jgi:predicted transcriptional regulator